MQVYVEDDLAIVKCSYHEKEIVKAIGDFKFDKKTASWKFPQRKLIDIIDNLKIEYSQATALIYQQLREERSTYHSQINLANTIKTIPTKFLIDKIDVSQCYIHQHQAIHLGSIFNSYAFFMETGTGKTLVAIKLMEYWKVPTMVVAPLSTIESVWKREIEKWSNLKSVVLWHNMKEFNNSYDVYLVNYEGFKKLSKDTKGKLSEKVQCLIVDESSKMKNPKSQISKTILHYKDKIKHRICLTGTPAPNNLLEYFGQMAFINSDLLGDNFYRFRNKYFYSTGYGGYMYKPLKNAKEAIIDRVSHQAFSIRKDDCLDLPDRVYETRSIYMDEAQQAAYDQMKRDNILEFKGHTTLGANELSKLMKLRQITAGFTITTSGLPVLISDTKINALKELLEEIPEDKQVIIWCQFHWEIERLKKEFKGDNFTLYGRMPQKEKEDAILGFQEGKKRLLIAHPLSGGMGLTFTNCSYIIWFSLSYSQEQYSQANDRIYRIGQKNKCTYFLLLAKKTIDEVIYKILNKKADLMHACMEMLKG